MAEAKKINPLVKTALELGPVLLFFIGFTMTKGQTYLIAGSEYSGFLVMTAALIVMIMITSAIYWALTGTLSRMQILTLVLVVVCLPLCKAFEISPVAACALGTKRLTKVLLPAPEGPKIKVVLPCNWASSSSKPAPLFSDKAKVVSPICRYGSIRCQASANAGPKSDLLTTSKGVMP